MRRYTNKKGLFILIPWDHAHNPLISIHSINYWCNGRPSTAVWGGHFGLQTGQFSLQSVSVGQHVSRLRQQKQWIKQSLPGFFSQKISFNLLLSNEEFTAVALLLVLVRLSGELLLVPSALRGCWWPIILIFFKFISEIIHVKFIINLNAQG